jgi:PhnB protein
MKKTEKVKSVPEGFSTVTPYLVVDGASDLIDFLKNGFEAQEVFRMNRDDNRVSHATVKIGNSMIMISDTMTDMHPELAMLYLYVDDADAIYKKAIGAHAESIQEPHDEFYGDRVSAVKDKWGNKWWIATQKEKVAGDELERRAKERWKAQEEAHAIH